MDCRANKRTGNHDHINTNDIHVHGGGVENYRDRVIKDVRVEAPLDGGPIKYEYTVEGYGPIPANIRPGERDHNPPGSFNCRSSPVITSTISKATQDASEVGGSLENFARAMRVMANAMPSFSGSKLRAYIESERIRCGGLPRLRLVWLGTIQPGQSNSLGSLLRRMGFIWPWKV